MAHFRTLLKGGPSWHNHKMTRIMQDGLVATAEVQALLAVDAGITILVSKKVRLTDWNRRKIHI
jgi:hypothetical protein